MEYRPRTPRVILLGRGVVFVAGCVVDVLGRFVPFGEEEEAPKRASFSLEVSGRDISPEDLRRLAEQCEIEEQAARRRNYWWKGYRRRSCARGPFCRGERGPLRPGRVYRRRVHRCRH